MTNESSELDGKDSVELRVKVGNGNVSSQRALDLRRLFRKLTALAGLGITGVLLSQEKTGILPTVSAATITIDTANVGAGTTSLQSSLGLGAALQAEATSTGGNTTMGISGISDATGGGSGPAVGVRGTASSLSGSTVGVLGLSNSTSGIGVEGEAVALSGGIGVLALSGNSTAKPLVAKGASGQSANLQEWQSSSGTALSVVDASGKLGIGTGSPQYGLHVVTGTVGPLTAASSPPGSAPNSFICQNLTPGNAKSQFTFRDSTSANRYSFGNDQSGNGSQNFFIYDEVGHIFPLTIDSSGHVHLLDLVFANGIRATEDGNALAFKNKSGKKIALLDDDGNLHIKGKVIEDL